MTLPFTCNIWVFTLPQFVFLQSGVGEYTIVLLVEGERRVTQYV